MSEIDKLKSIGARAYSTFETVLNTFELSKKAIDEKIDGDFVECGIAAGVQVGVMAYANQNFKGDKKIWCFDSFEGIPLASRHDDSQPGIGDFTPVESERERLVSSGVTVHGLDQVKSHIKEWGIDLSQFKFVKGWFEDTVEAKSKKIDKISLLRLDGDLYYSTKVCLECLYPKLSVGGYLIIDDWELKGCRKACDEYLDYSKLSPVNHIENSTPVWFQKK